MTRKAIWTVVSLVGLYVLCQAVADVAATKFVQLGNITLPAGSMIFAVTFTLRDLIHKRLGKEWARAAIVLCGGFNVIQAAYLAWMAHLPAPAFYQLTQAWSSIFAIVPAITIASIIAEVTSELVDTEVYHFWFHRVTRGKLQWSSVLASNAISLPLDSFIFGTLAFVVLPNFLGGQPIPFMDAMALVAGQIVWKAAVTMVSLPTIYLVKHKPMLALSATTA